MHPWLTQGFTRFLRRRRARRHFERHPLLDTLATARRPAPGQALRDAVHADPAQALAALGTQADGLTDAEAAARLARDGPNEIRHEPPLPAALRLWRCYVNPFNLLLTALAVLSWVGADARATVVIAAMVALSTGIRFVQEGRSHRAAEGLRALVGNTASVLRRPGGLREVPQRDLVAGDVVALSAGDMVPADARVLTARDLFVAEAAMTGESQPAEKFAQAPPGVAPGGADDALNPREAVFMGTSVVSGTATALVVATGGRSAFGALAADVEAADSTPNAFQAGVNGVSWLLIRFAAVMVPLVFVINGLTKGDWLQAFLFALSVAVGLTPEMLPMIVTSTLARGAVRLARLKVVVKRLDAIQNFGAMDILCTDKTGTLTQDRVALARRTDAQGRDSTEVLRYAGLNSLHQTGLKNLLDHAVLDHLGAEAAQALARERPKIDEVPFDFQRRRMSVVVGGADASHELICKGAVEEVLAVCTRMRGPGPGPDGAPVDADLDADGRARTQAFTAGLNAEGLRVVAVAVRTLPPGQVVCSVADEAGLTLVGYIGFLDPPKESAAPALRALAAHGITVKVLTGDNAAVARQVCRLVALPVDGVLSGEEVEAMDDVALRDAALRHTLFVKLAPLHKARLVRALRDGGHVVGFLGDGINDAPALRAADIGISVHSAVDIAREAADIILLEKSLAVLDQGVVEGRTTFCNMLKYIRMTASANFGNVLSVLVASAFLPFLPMLPLQLLVQNLLYDVSQAGIPFDHVDADLVMRPLAWHPSDIGRFMLAFGPVSSLFDLVTFAVLWWVFDARTPAQQGLFQSGWFVVGLLTQTLVVHMVRTPRLPFVQSRASATLMATTLVIAVVGVWLPQGPLAAYFHLQPLPGVFFVWGAGILAGYLALTTVVKRVYIRRHGWQ